MANCNILKFVKIFITSLDHIEFLFIIHIY